MKHLLSLILAAVLLLTFASAHGAGTDAAGGHRDNKNKSGLGSYHYHCNNSTAHLHTNGICPYANKPPSTTTRSHSGGSVNTKASSTAKITTAAATTKATTASTTKATTKATTVATGKSTVNTSPSENEELPLLAKIWFAFCFLLFGSAFIQTICELFENAILSIKKMVLYVNDKIAGWLYVIPPKNNFELEVNSLDKQRIIDASVSKVSIEPDMSFSITDFFFKKKMRRRTIIFVVILLICMSVGGKYMNEAYQLNKQLTELKEQYSLLLSDHNNMIQKYDDLSATYDAYLVKYKDLFSKYNAINPEYNFYHDYAVTVASDNGHNYHKYGCHYMEGRSFYIFNKETAIVRGYEPCYDCYYEDIK